MGQFNDQVQLYRRGLAKKLQAAAWTSVPIWSKLQGHTMGTEGPYPRSAPHGKQARKAMRPTFKPVEVFTDFMHDGGWEMDMTIHHPLTEKASYGDKPALGTGETKKFTYYKALINEVVKTVKVKDGLMGEQAVKNPTNILAIIKNSSMDINDWYLRWSGHAHWDAMMRGFSDNILAAQAEGGFGDNYTQRSHPNMYTAGDGKVTWSDTPATYETNCATDIGALTTGDELTVARLRAMVATAPGLKIRKAMMGKGADYYIILIDSFGAFQLQSDTAWATVQANAAARSSETNKLFTGIVEGYIEGAYIMIDDTIPGARVSGDTGYLSARGTVNYHNPNPLESPIDAVSVARFAVLLGASAIAVGNALPIQFKSESWEFDRHKEDAGISIIGYNRTDNYDNDGYFGTAGLFKENVSSLVFAYYAGAGIVY